MMMMMIIVPRCPGVRNVPGLDMAKQEGVVEGVVSPR
jgi:hypothetical protein